MGIIIKIRDTIFKFVINAVITITMWFIMLLFFIFIKPYLFFEELYKRNLK